MVRGLAELHGGSVHASSPGPGAGARFVIRLPLERESRTAPAAAPREERALASRRIVLIEDHGDSAAALELFLRGQGQEVHVASSGESGLRLVRQVRPALVLCDLHLGDGLDGCDVARALRNDPETREIALIAVTGKSRPEELERARAAGFDRCWVKPVELPALVELLGALER
jgi:CheY-like chemotaxis protein